MVRWFDWKLALFYLSISDDRSVRGLDLRLGGCRQKCRLVYRASVRWRRPVGEFPWHATRHLWHNPRQRDTIGRSASKLLPRRLLLRPTIKTFLHLFPSSRLSHGRRTPTCLSAFRSFFLPFSPTPMQRLRTCLYAYSRISKRLFSFYNALDIFIFLFSA